MAETIITADAPKIKAAILEMSNALTRIEAEREFIKEAIDALSEEYELDKKIIRKTLKAYHKASFSQEEAEANDFFAFYTTVVETK
jgi:hypothetical protein